MTSAQEYISKAHKVYNLENAKDPKSDLFQLIKPALVEKLIKGMTFLTSESLPASTGVNNHIEEAKIEFAISMSEKVRKQIDSGASQGIISDNIIPIALYTDVLTTPPLVMSRAFQEVFKDDINKSPNPDRYLFVDLAKLKEPALQDKFLRVSKELLENIAEQKAQSQKDLNQTKLKNILNKSLEKPEIQKRDILKAMDYIIEQGLIFPVKYPKNTSFIRKLLHLAPKLKDQDIYEDFKYLLPNVTDKLKAQILKNPKFHDTEGQLIITNAQLNLMIYERISIKATKQLGIDKETVDKVFLYVNDRVYDNIIEQNTQFEKAIKAENPIDMKKFQDGLNRELNDLIPPHLLSKEQISTLLNLDKTGCVVASIQTIETHLKKISAYPTREVDCINMLQYLRAANSKEVHRYDVQIQSAQERLYTRLSTQMHSDQKFPKNRLSDFEKAGIDLFKKAQDNPIALNIHEKKYLTEFIEYSSGNKKFNKRLGSIQGRDNIIIRENYSSLNILHKYSHKTSNINKTQQVNTKLDYILTQYSDGTKDFMVDQKVSLHDIGYVSKMDDKNISAVTQIIKTADLKSKKLDDISRVYDASCRIKKKLDEAIGAEINLTAGELLMDVAKSHHALNHHKKNLITKFHDFITPYSHAAIGIGNNKVHEIMANYRNIPSDPINSLATDQFVIAPERLISDKICRKVAAALNISDHALLGKKLQEMYQKIALDINNDNGVPSKGLADLKENVQNSASRRNNAGLADIIPFGHRGQEKVRSWAQKVSSKRDNGQSIGSILASETNEMICSEFAAKMTILTLVELDKEITKVIQAKDPMFKPPTDGIIRLPFDPKEDLSKISPERLVKELQRVNAINTVPKKGLAQAAIRR